MHLESEETAQSHVTGLQAVGEREGKIVSVLWDKAPDCVESSCSFSFGSAGVLVYTEVT